MYREYTVESLSSAKYRPIFMQPASVDQQVQGYKYVTLRIVAQNMILIMASLINLVEEVGMKLCLSIS